MALNLNQCPDTGLWRVGNKSEFTYKTAAEAQTAFLHKLQERKRKLTDKITEIANTRTFSSNNQDKILDFLLHDDIGIDADCLDVPEEKWIEFDKDFELNKIRLAKKKEGIEETFYKYAPKPGAKFDKGGGWDERSRDFCIILMKANKIYTKEEINRISFQLRYSVFNYAGGINCRHRWLKIMLESRPNKKSPGKGRVYVNPVPGKRREE